MKVITATQAAEIASETRKRLISATIEEIKDLKTNDAVLYGALEHVFDKVSELSSSHGSVVVAFYVNVLFSVPYRNTHIEQLLLLLRLLGYEAAFSPDRTPRIVVSWSR